MNLMSCKHCWVVLDKDKIQWQDAYDSDTGYAKLKAELHGDEYVMPAECPVCKGKIYREGK